MSEFMNVDDEFEMYEDNQEQFQSNDLHDLAVNQDVIKSKDIKV